MTPKITANEIIKIYSAIKKKNNSFSFPNGWYKTKKEFMKIAPERGIKDPGQSWKTASGKAFELLAIRKVLDITSNKEFIQNNISVESWASLNLNQKRMLEYELIRKCCGERVSRSSEPDIIIFKKNTPKFLVSCKSSLRDRVNMDLFWALEYKKRGLIFTLVCAETSETIGTCKNPKKPRILAESLYDKLYIINGDIDYCEIVRPFSDLKKDLKRLLF